MKVNNVNKTNTLSKSKYISFSKSSNDDDEYDEVPSDNFCGYYLEQRALTRLIVPIDTEFKDAKYYRMVCNKIAELTENDVVEFTINSPGGNLGGLVTLLHAIRTTEAETVATVVGDAYSAASLLALACDSINLGPYATFLCHSASFSARGKSTDVRSHVTHVSDYAESIFRECYEYFLSEEEIEDVLAGKEMYLNNQQIRERLEHKYKILQEIADSQCCGDPDNCDDICNCPCAKDE